MDDPSHGFGLPAGVPLPPAVLWTLVVLFAVAAAAGIVYSIARFRAGLPKWVALNGVLGVVGPTPCAWFTGEMSEDHLRQALSVAVAVLVGHTRWGNQIYAAVNQIYIRVIPADQWTDLWGRQVAGEQLNQEVQVGHNLAALCHELGHFLELKLDQKVDAAHAGWAANGIFDAINDYQIWLAASH